MPSTSVPIVNASLRRDSPGRIILRLFLNAVSVWLSRRETRLELERLSDRQLRDIGIERTEQGYRVTPGSPASRYRGVL